MRIGVYQFSSTNRMDHNLKIIHKAIRLAAENKVKLLAFHECALCGYPPIESKIEEIRKEDIENALAQISVWTRQYHMYVAVGSVRFDNGQRFNSMIMFGNRGEIIGYYDKKALWGWDADHFTMGTREGIFEIDDVKVGFRICFDIRFPELFRELYRQNVDICVVSFSDTKETPQPERYHIIKAHLITRAMENVMPIVSVNSITNFQTAPTAVFDWNGCCVKEAEKEIETLLLYDYEKPEMSFGIKGRVANNNLFLKMDSGYKLRAEESENT